MKRVFIYHYCAFMGLPDGRQMNWDGIATYNSLILTNEDYFGLKQLINKDEAPNIIISALTLLAETKVQEQENG